MILVTGATGAVGRHLVLELKTLRAPVRALTRDPRKANALLGPVETVVGDLSRPEVFPRALDGVESVFLLSALDPELPSWEAAFARAAKKAGVKRLVKLSALGADPRSPAAVLRWHGEAEAEVLRVGPPSCVLRASAFHQNLLSHARAIRGGTLSAPMGTARVAMVDARDVAVVARAALTSDALDGKTLTLAAPPARTYAEVAEAFSRALGRPVAYADASADIALQGMLAAGMPAWTADALLGLCAQFRAGKADVACGDLEKALGRAPISLDRFIRDRAADFA